MTGNAGEFSTFLKELVNTGYIKISTGPGAWKKDIFRATTFIPILSEKPSLEKIKVYARGWLNYYGIASMKNNIDDINGWLYHRIRMCIWKQWNLLQKICIIRERKK